jgi:hypothetical protein
VIRALASSCARRPSHLLGRRTGNVAPAAAYVLGLVEAELAAASAGVAQAPRASGCGSEPPTFACRALFITEDLNHFLAQGACRSRRSRAGDDATAEGDSRMTGVGTRHADRVLIMSCLRSRPWLNSIIGRSEYRCRTGRRKQCRGRAVAAAVLPERACGDRSQWWGVQSGCTDTSGQGKCLNLVPSSLETQSL